MADMNINDPALLRLKLAEEGRLPEQVQGGKDARSGAG